MLRILFLGLIIICLSGMKLNAEKMQVGENLPDTLISFYLHKINPDSIQSYMQSLEDFGTRFCLADNRKQVAEWIRDKFIAMGYINAYLDSFQFNRWYSGTYYQTWQFNVVATYHGYSGSDSVFVLGAHHDAIVPFSSNPFLIAPGADDNASGVAATLEIARIMKQYAYQPAYNIKFITFAAEELGLHGSKNYANKAAASGMNIICMINNDMISYCTLPEENWKVQIQKYPNSAWFTNLAHQIIQNYTILTAVESTQYIQYSDSWPFYQNGYNAIFFIEDQFTPFYHTVNDLVSTTNKYYAAENTKISLGMLVYLNGSGSPPLLIPEELILQDTILPANKEACFAALRNILVAGNGTLFFVNPDAHAQFVAGESIVFLPGTMVFEGGSLLARITTDSTYCSLPGSKQTIPQITNQNRTANKKINPEPDFIVFPNPTRGVFTVESDIQPLTSELKLEIFDLIGTRIATENIVGNPTHQFDISNLPNGIYFLRISNDKKIRTEKIIKN